MNARGPSGDKQGSPNQTSPAEEALRRSAESLAKSEAFYRSLVENLPQNILRKDLEGRFTYANQNFCRLVGRPLEEVLGKTDFDLYPAELAEKYRADDRAVMRSGKLLDQIEQNRLPTGEMRDVHVLKVPTYDAEGRPLGTQSIFWDITERKRAEEALRQSEQERRALFEGALDPIIVADAQTGIVIDCNRAACELVGRDKSELIGQHQRILHPPEATGGEFSPTFREHRAEKAGQVLATQVITKSGEIKDVEIKADFVEVGGKRMLQGIFRDVTERKRGEAALKASEQRFRGLIENSRDAIALLDEEGTILFFPIPATARILGYDDRELVGRSIFELIHPDDRSRISAISAQLLEAPRRQVTAQVRFQHKDGSWRWLEATGTNLLAEPSVQAVVINYADITERKRAEEALAREHNLLRTLIDNLPDTIYAKDREARKTLANRADLEMIGAQNEAAVLGKTDFEVFPPEVAAKFWADDQAVLQTGKPVINREELLVSSSGERRWLLTSKLPVRDQSGQITGIIGIGRDITERKQAEEQRLNLERQVQQAQKLESLGVLAGGIAHDFNNILTAIMGNINLALLDLSPAAPARDELVEAERATRRAAELVKQMLAYSGRGRFRVQRLDLQEVIEEMTHLLQASISKKAVLRFNFAANVPAIEADATQLRQVIMNLVINASEAIGERSGVIAISTGAMECDEAYLATTWLREALPAGLYTYLEVADTGCGITKEQLPRIFDPFFTTKFTGRGLGLAAVLGIARGHRGAIKVYTEAGKGSTFKVLFPAASQAAESLDEAVAGPTRWQGSGLLLLVDDEESVRAIGKRILERLGFEVLTADDGRAALEVFRARPDAIAAVVLDLTMPHMDGEETFRELRRIRADVRVILSSGYNEQEVVQRFAGKGLAGFVQKPYTMDNLRAALQPLFPGSNRTAPPAAS